MWFCPDRISLPSATGLRLVYQTTYQKFSQKAWLWQNREASPCCVVLYVALWATPTCTESFKKQILVYLLWVWCGEKLHNKDTKTDSQSWCWSNKMTRRNQSHQIPYFSSILFCINYRVWPHTYMNTPPMSCYKIICTCLILFTMSVSAAGLHSQSVTRVLLFIVQSTYSVSFRWINWRIMYFRQQYSRRLQGLDSWKQNMKKLGMVLNVVSFIHIAYCHMLLEQNHQYCGGCLHSPGSLLHSNALLVLCRHWNQPELYKDVINFD